MPIGTNECTRIMRLKGLPYPRTCPVCKLGPCQRNEEVARLEAMPKPLDISNAKPIDGGLTQEKMLEIRDRILENRRRIDGCKQHTFRPFSAMLPQHMFGQKHECLNCGGKINGEDILTYVQGYIAAGGDPTDIVPDWNASVPDAGD